MYYKNKENQPYFKPSKEIIKRDGLVVITKEEFDQIVYEINNPPLTEEQEQARLKAIKDEKLRTLVVTTSNGNTFDGNLDARVNMLSAIQSAELIGKTEEYWKLADNSVVLISLTELKEALALAINKVGEIVTGTDEGDVQ